MDEYQLLREQAKRKRDQAIADAREEFRKSSMTIRCLRVRLKGKSRARRRDILPPIRDVLPAVLPSDRLFTAREAFELLKASDPTRHFHYESVRTHFSVMKANGLVRRVKQLNGRIILWAVADYQTPATVFGTRSLLSVAEQIIREQGPKQTVEIAIYAQSQGYRADDEPRVLTTAFMSALVGCPDRFARGPDKRWVLTG